MLSLIIPTRNWSAERIDACIRSFLRLKSKTLNEIVVVDFGSKEPIKVAATSRRVPVRVVRVDAARWSLAEAINVGVVSSRNAIVAKTDADIIVARESGPGIDSVVEAIAGGDTSVAVVQAIDLPPDFDVGQRWAQRTAPRSHASGACGRGGDRADFACSASRRGTRSAASMLASMGGATRTTILSIEFAARGVAPAGSAGMKSAFSTSGIPRPTRARTLARRGPKIGSTTSTTKAHTAPSGSRTAVPTVQANSTSSPPPGLW